MHAGQLPVLWLYGPPGVGKTAVAWAMYAELARAGTAAAFVDIDQLGMCYPEPTSDPGRHRMQARNLNAVVANFAAAGAQCVIVSGVVNPVGGVPVDVVPAAALTGCRLRAAGAELRQRFRRRQGPDAPVDAVLDEAAAWEGAGSADPCVDTTGRSVDEVVRLVGACVGDWPPATESPATESAATESAVRFGEAPTTDLTTDVITPGPADGTSLWLSGVTGVGTSSVGFEVYRRLLRAGYTAAYLDLDQVGFCAERPTDPGNHRVQARNLAALWRTFRVVGAQRFVVVGPAVDDAVAAAYADTLPAANRYRLHAGRGELTRRILSRRGGGSWAQPGDPLVGQPVEHLERVADRAARDAATVDAAGVGGVRIDTDGRTVAEAADLIATELGWSDI